MFQVWANKIGGELPRIVRVNEDRTLDAWLYHHAPNPYQERGAYEWTRVSGVDETHVPYFTGTFEECQSHIEATRQ